MADMDQKPEISQKEIEEIKEKLRVAVKSMADSGGEIVLTELSRALDMLDLKEKMEKGLLPYLAAAGFLAFSGRDIDVEGIGRVILALGMVPNTDLLRDMAALKYKNHIVYASALYYLIAIGIEPTPELLVRLVLAIDVHPDAKLARFVIDFYNENNKKK